MPTLISELRQEHKGISEILDCLDRQVGRFARGEPLDFDVLTAALEYFEGFPDERHHPKEDLVYEQLRRRDEVSAWIVGDLTEAHSQLRKDFHAVAEAIRAVQHEAELPRDALVDWARRFIDRQRSHMAMEEANFFPAAERALNDEDWESLAAAILHEPNDPESAAAETRYRALRQAVLAWDAEDRGNTS